MLSGDLISKSIEHRAELFRELQCFRLFDGRADGDARFFIDRYLGFALIHYLPTAQDETTPELPAECLDVLCSHGKVTSVYLRIHARGSRHPQEAVLLHGQAIDQLIVDEQGLQFLVKPQAQFNAGLFLDTRELRRTLVQKSRGLKVLNTFCFTGTLGIAALVGGAREVNQIDVSKSALSWAQQNMGLNPSHGNVTMRFLPDEVGEYILRQGRKVRSGMEPYDLVILDPPSFGQSRRKVFSFRQDIQALVSDTLDLYGKRGQLLLTTNSRSFSPADLRALLSSAAHSKRYRIVSCKEIFPPKPDFRSQGTDSIAIRGIWAELSV